MSNPLRSAEDYELFLYTLPDQFPSVHRSTVTFVRRGSSLARIVGELHFAHHLRVVVRERILFHRLPAIIDWYGYEIWQGEERLFWYDPQPHPNEPELQSTHPHHKHISPDIKHNRVPAPGMSFNQPNLPQIIREVENLIQQIERE
ncbi:MAG: hypothetical protein KJ069_04230 [Anaerolineae bacterium]|nr:hypothetical protein [Anaerolineae bacterium]